MNEQQARLIIWKVAHRWGLSYESVIWSCLEWQCRTLHRLPVPGVGLIELVEALAVVKASKERVR